MNISNLFKGKIPCFRRLNRFIVSAVLALSVLSMAPAFARGGGGGSTCDPNKLTDTELSVGLDNLYKVFQQVDVYYATQPGGITADQALALGIWGDTSQIVVNGPFQPLPNGAQVAPGSVASQGAVQSSMLQSFFDGQLKVAFPGSIRHHHYPQVSNIFYNSRSFSVNTHADILDSNGNLIAVEKGLANYKLPCGVDVPIHTWIIFTIEWPLFFPH